MKRKHALVLCVLCCMALLAAMPAFAGPKNTLVFSMEAEIPALDPQKANAAPSFTVGNGLFEALIRTVDGKVTPGMAQSWTTSKDGKTLTFKIRDAKWSDGVAVSAKDFEYGIKRLLDPKTASEYAFAAYYITGAEAYNLGKNPDAASVGVKATDDKTLVITLNNPTPYFIAYLGAYCFAPARRDIVEKYGDAYATAADKAVYNGPFILKEWKNEQSKLLVKNKGYWNAKAIKLDAVEILQISDTGTALAMYENGELDFVEVPSTLFKQYENKAGAFYNGADDFIKFQVQPNPAKPWLQNVNFRKAIGYAIDRESYCNIATKGLYVPALRYVLPIVMGVDKKYGEEYPLEAYPPKADVAKAKDYLNKALAELKIANASDISVEYLIQDLEECRLMAETLQQQVEKNLGIHFTIKLVPRKQRTAMEQKHEYDMVYGGWMPDYDDPMTYMEIWLGDSSQNNSGYASAAFDKYVKDAFKESDAKKRMNMLFNAEKTLLADAPLVPLQIRRKVVLENSRVVNLSKPLVGAVYDFVYASVK
ncbi:MAG TPA: peptide ABC transporter substrate-binding protein [Rectinemataceae bacterium]|nr:peptide ABC transporter substrate-binding protein [Rectinemataceae bacterium]